MFIGDLTRDGVTWLKAFFYQYLSPAILSAVSLTFCSFVCTFAVRETTTVFEVSLLTPALFSIYSK